MRHEASHSAVIGFTFPPPNTASMTTTKHCLLVDDDPEDQEMFIDALHEISATAGCFAVSNGEEALRRLLDSEYSPDYIFTDLQMPVMDGLDFLKGLRGMERFRHIPVIVFSSDVSEAQVAKFKQLGVSAIYLKHGEDALKQMLKKYFATSKISHTIL